MTSGEPTGPGEQGLDKAAAWLTGGLVAAVTFLGALGTAQGGVERMLRNFPVGGRAALLLITLGVLVAVGALIPTGWKRGLLAIALGVFSCGIVLSVGLVSYTPSTRERPTVVATLGREADARRWTLEAEFAAAGLQSTETLRMVVDGLLGPLRLPTRLYEGEVGPDPAGKVEINISVPIPRRRFSELGVAAGVRNLRDECFEEEATGPSSETSQQSRVGWWSRAEEDAPEKGCVVLAVPPFKRQVCVALDERTELIPSDAHYRLPKCG